VSKELPGSFGHPVLGELLAFKKDAHKFHADHIAKYGNVYKTKLGPLKMVCFSGPEAVEFFNDERHFTRQNGSPKPIQELMHPDAIPFLGGERFHKRRQCLMNAFTPEAISGYQELIDGIVEHHLDEWSSVAEVKGVEAIGRLAFAVGDSLYTGADPMKVDTEKSHTLDTALKGMFAPVPVDIPFTTYGKAIKARDKLRAALSDVVESYEPAGQKHVLARLWEARDEDGDGLTKDELKIELLHFYSASYGGTQAAGCNMVKAMSSFPEPTSKMRDEVTRVMPDGPVGERRGDLEYTTWYTKEVRRLYPLVPSTFVGIAIEDCEFQGYRIPKGYSGIAICHAAMMTEDNFADPTAFEPERYREGSGLPADSWVPHGGGPWTGHRCAGQDLATQILVTLAAHLVRDYELTVPPQDMSDQLGGVAPLPKGGLRFSLKKR